VLEELELLGIGVTGNWLKLKIGVWCILVSVFGWLTDLRVQVQIFPFKSAIRQGL
jgi:hypothetical protein